MTTSWFTRTSTLLGAAATLAACSPDDFAASDGGVEAGPADGAGEASDARDGGDAPSPDAAPQKTWCATNGQGALCLDFDSVTTTAQLLPWTVTTLGGAKASIQSAPVNQPLVSPPNVFGATTIQFNLIGAPPVGRLESPSAGLPQTQASLEFSFLPPVSDSANGVQAVSFAMLRVLGAPTALVLDLVEENAAWQLRRVPGNTLESLQPGVLAPGVWHRVRIWAAPASYGVDVDGTVAAIVNASAWPAKLDGTVGVLGTEMRAGPIDTAQAPSYDNILVRVQ